jgi:hypothetical protein
LSLPSGSATSWGRWACGLNTPPMPSATQWRANGHRLSNASGRRHWSPSTGVTCIWKTVSRTRNRFKNPIYRLFALGTRILVCASPSKKPSGEDLFHGLVEQLPAYMRAKGSDFGIYCVTYFKRRDFNKPERYDMHTLELALEVARRASGLQSITIRIFDLSRRRSPSQA